MALPITHPLWAAFAVILPITLFTGVLVYARAEHIALPSLVALKGARWLKRAGCVGAATSAAAIGIVAAVVYGQLLAWDPGAASLVFSAAGVIGGSVMGTVAVLQRRERGLGGGWELALLCLLWGGGYGLLVPLVSGSPA